jgi:hypothetical protein
MQSLFASREVIRPSSAPLQREAPEHPGDWPESPLGAPLGPVVASFLVHPKPKAAIGMVASEVFLIIFELRLKIRIGQGL